MSYREQLNFDRPSAEDVQRLRRNIAWLAPLFIVQDSVVLFRPGADLFTQILWTVAWASSSLLILWPILGLPMRWLSERDREILDDDWHRYLSGEASRWGLATVVLLGCAVMLVRFWYPLDAGATVFGLVDGALLVAVGRYAWLNRADPDEE